MRLLLDIKLLLDVPLQRPTSGMASRNHRDFKKSPVPALTPDAFLARHGS